MKLSIVNNTSFEKLILTVDGREYSLPKGGKSELNLNEKSENLSFKIGDKNRVVFNWIFALIDGFVCEDYVWLDLNCNASFNVSFNSENESTVFLENIKTYPVGKRFTAGECFYKSVYLKSENVFVNSSSYSLTECKKEQNKSLFLLRFVLSWFSVDFALIILSLLLEEGGLVLLILFALLLLFCTIPSFRKAKRFEKYFTDDLANSSLAAEEEKQRANNGEPVLSAPSDLINKGITKVLDKIFKKK